MSTLATDAERMDAANEHTVDKHATNATAKDLPNAAEPTDSAPSSASKARKPKAAKSRQDNAGSASTAVVPIGNGEQTPMGASAITPATGLAGAAASPKNMGVSPMRGVNLSPASPHITGQKLLAVPKPVQEEEDLVMVRYMDFGNMETVKKSALCHLPSSLVKMGPVAVRVRVGGMEGVSRPIWSFF